MMGRLGASGSTSRPANSYVCRHGRVHNYNNTSNNSNGYNSNSNIDNSQITASLTTNQALGMTQQPIMQPQQQGFPVNTMDPMAGVGFMNSPVPTMGFMASQYSTPVPDYSLLQQSQMGQQPIVQPGQPGLLPASGYTTPSLVNNSETGYAGVQYQPQAYQTVQYVPSAGHVQTQSVFHS